MQYRRLGNTDMQISTVALGTWPMAGMTSLNVNDPDSLATIQSALDSGVNFFDTAYCYGPNGESEKLLACAGKSPRSSSDCHQGRHSLGHNRSNCPRCATQHFAT